MTTNPGTLLLSDVFINVKVPSAVIVNGFIASLNVALTELLIATSVAALTGFVRITVGAVVSAKGGVMWTFVSGVSKVVQSKTPSPSASKSAKYSTTVTTQELLSVILV